MKKRILQISLFFIALMMGTISVFAQETRFDFTVGDIKYRVEGNDCIVLGPVNTDHPSIYGTISIPATVNYGSNVYSVTKVADSAFWNCIHVTGLSLPNSNSLKHIGKGAFGRLRRCNGGLVIPNSVETIDNEAFREFAKDESATLGNLTIGNSVTTIGEFAFIDSRFYSALTLPHSLTTIGKYAFRRVVFNGHSSMGNSSLQFIGKYAFAECTTLMGVLRLPQTLVTIEEHAFDGCTGLEGIELNSPLSYIGNYAFYNCSGFRNSLILPNSVTYIGNYAFCNCGFDRNLVLGHGVTTIGNGAFQSVPFTGYLDIPNSVTQLGYEAFKDCTFTGDLEIGNGLERIQYGTFCGTQFQGHLYLGNSIKHIDSIAFSNTNGNLPHPRFTSWQGLPEGLETIGYAAFSWSFNMNGQHLTIPNSVTNIEKFAFFWHEFSSITLGSSLENIDDYAFYNDDDPLQTINILATTPPTIGFMLFSNWSYIPITVPCESGAAYEASPWNDQFTQIIEDCDAIETVEANGTTNIYPNPSKGIVSISAENLQHVEIYNMTGQKVFETEVSGNEFEYDFGGSTGIYLFKVETAKGIETQRVVVK